jgi:hypothetical protein
MSRVERTKFRSYETHALLCDFLDDPVCDLGNPCVASACPWDANLEHRKCVFGPMDSQEHPFCCNDAADCIGPSGPLPCIANQCASPCSQDLDCDDGDPETADTCEPDPGTPCSDEGHCVHSQ